MTRILALPMSLRRNSFNRRLANAAAELAPGFAEVEVGSIAGIPLYDADVEAELGQPEAAEKLKDTIAEIDGLLICTPEYQTSIPGVAKNAMDWMARPPGDVERVWADLPVGLIGATPGRGGTRFSQSAWQDVLRYLGTRPWNGATLYVAGARDVFDDEGALADEKVRELLGRYMAGFAEHCRDLRRRRPG
jgi:NAD(P)H-dependent FMN reductase